MRNVHKILITFLVLVALGVGYVLYSSQETQMSASPSNISLDELREIMDRYDPNLSAFESLQHFKSVGQAAVDSPVLDVSGCVVTPNVMRLKLKQSFKLSNQDIVAHQIDYGDQLSVVAPANTQKKVTLDFPNLGNYLLHCDQSGEIVGLFLVTP